MGRCMSTMYETHVHVRMQQMNIVCVWAMFKIGTDTTEAHKTHNLMLAWPKPSKRRNSSNKNAQNAATETKLVPLNKRAKYASKIASEKSSVHTAKTFGKAAKQVYLAFDTKTITKSKHKTNGNVVKDHKLQQQKKLCKIGHISNC